MHAYRRHQLVRLTEAGWRGVLHGAPGAPARWDAQALDCLRHWAEHHLPLVVTRQRDGWLHTQPPESLSLGLPAPARWGRRRLSLRVPRTAVLHFDEFPAAERIGGLLPRRVRTPWRALCAAFERQGVTARVCGSYGWQQLTGLACVHPASDIDLVFTLANARSADALGALLQRAPFERPRLDGEFAFHDGAAVAWREWAPWRSGRVARILVKRLNGAALEDAATWEPGVPDHLTAVAG